MPRSSRTEAPRERPDEVLDAVQAELGRRTSWLKFARPLEDRYRLASDTDLMRHFPAVVLFASLCYNLYLPLDWAMMPDVANAGTVVQLFIVTPSILASLLLMIRHQRVIMTVVTANFAMALLGTVLLFHLSRAPGAHMFPFIFPAFIVAGLLVPLPFRQSAFLNAIYVLALIPALLLHAGYTPPQITFILAVSLNTVAYALITAHRMEARERTAYLLNLRDGLRAETLARNNQHLRALSDTDGLTGIGNRRFLDTTLDRLWAEARKAGTPAALLLMDIDHFKELNDTYGHPAGDRCLLIFADLLREHTRDGRDTAGRFGGEEFALLLPGASLAEAQGVAERIRHAVEALTVPLDGTSCAMRISVGCASMVPDAHTPPEALIQAADRALYCAKRAGRNRIHPQAGIFAY